QGGARLARSEARRLPAAARLAHRAAAEVVVVVGVVILAFTWVAAAACARAFCNAHDSRSFVASAVVATGMLAVLPGELARLTDDLPAAMLLSALAFVVVTLVIRRYASAPPQPLPLWLPQWPALLLAAIGFAFVVHGALFRNFFDENHHVPMAMV